MLNMLYRLYFYCLLLGVIACFAIVTITVISSEYGITSLEYTKIQWSEVPVRKTKEIARLQFTSPDDYLGIIYLPFKKSQPLTDVPVTILIINTESERIVHYHEYSAKSFSDKPYFPVGLPVVKDSKNRRYQVVILNSSSKPMKIDFDGSKLIDTVHLVERNNLNRNSVVEFIKAKIITSVQKIGLWLYVPIFAVCNAFVLVIFLVFKLTKRNIQKLSYTSLLFFTQMISTGVVITIPSKIPDVFILVWLILLVFCSRSLGYGPKNHYIFAGFLLFFCSLPLVFFDIDRAYNATSMVFLLILTGFTEELWQQVNITQFFNKYVKNNQV